MVNLSHDLYLVLVEEGYISYDEYVRHVPLTAIPSEYATLASFLKNRGRVSKQIIESTSNKASRSLHLCQSEKEEPP